MIIKEELTNYYRELFGDLDDGVFSFAPGRVNLIGEHTDYNGGHVFPCALGMGVYVAGAARSDGRIMLYSLNRPEDGIVGSYIDDLRPLSDDGFAAYVKGMIWAFEQSGMKIDTGFDAVIAGDIPPGAGLSSSAALEVAVGSFLRELYGFDLSNKDIALLGKKAENDYVGMNCGIMDQFASAMGREGHAIYLDTESLDYRYVPLALEGKSIILTNTNKPHKLAGSAYNDRRRECAEALEIIRGAGMKIDSLGDLSAEEFESVKGAIDDPVLLKRARHAVSENQRTLDAVKALESGDIRRFGALMNASHESLRDDYEVSCEELDLLAEAAQQIGGVYGSRMTGGGFGGCTVTLADDSCLDELKARVSEKYREAFGYDCSFYTARAGGGTYAEKL